MAVPRILFPAINLKDGTPRCPQRLCREDTQIGKGIGRV